LRLLTPVALAVLALLPRTAPAQVDADTTPAGLWSAADDYLRLYLGDSLFEASVRRRPDLSLYVTNSSSTCWLPGLDHICLWPKAVPYVALYYDFDPMSDPLRTGLIAITTEPTGKVIREFPPAGVPNCRFYPERCRFSITADSAVTLARHATAAPPASRWQARFVWLRAPGVGVCRGCSERFAWSGDGIDTYGWEVTEEGGSEWRDQLVIEATTGEVLRRDRVLIFGH
jgi:hypothetical protein